jgi:hypothetical protein
MNIRLQSLRVFLWNPGQKKLKFGHYTSILLLIETKFKILFDCQSHCNAGLKQFAWSVVIGVWELL